MSSERPPTIDPIAAARWQAAAPALSPWLHEEVARRMEDRLQWIRQAPASWCHWDALRGGLQAHALVSARYPEARCQVFESAAHCEPVLAQIADETHDTVYLSERRGLEAVCSARALGDYPIKALTLDVGIRRPLGVGAGGLAILCALPPDEADEIVDANAARYAKLSTLEPAEVKAAVAEGRVRGWAFLDSPVFTGTAAVGVALPGEHPVAALSVAAISSRLDEARRAEVGAALQRHARRLGRLLAGLASAAGAPNAGPAA